MPLGWRDVPSWDRVRRRRVFAGWDSMAGVEKGKAMRWRLPPPAHESVEARPPRRELPDLPDARGRAGLSGG